MEIGKSQPRYTTYIESWDANPVAQVQAMINNGTINKNTMIDIAFGSYNWDSGNPARIPGLENLTKDQLKQIVTLIHNAGGKVSLSIGGANPAYNYYGSKMYGQPWATAKYINDAVTDCGIDGVDFDVEGESSKMPADFATEQAKVINTLRGMNSTLFISLTLTGKAFGPGYYQKDLLNLTKANIDSFAPMEYNFDIDSNKTYVQQIEADIMKYIEEWDVPASKITLGLMPGPDDYRHNNLTLDDAKELTQFAIKQGLKGIMTWDAEIDAKGAGGNSPYAYTKAIESILQPSSEIHRVGSGQNQRKVFDIEGTTLDQEGKIKGPKKPKGPQDLRKKL